MQSLWAIFTTLLFKCVSEDCYFGAQGIKFAVTSISVGNTFPVLRHAESYSMCEEEKKFVKAIHVLQNWDQNFCC